MSAGFCLHSGVLKALYADPIDGSSRILVDLLSLKQAFQSYPKAIGPGGIEFALTCELTRLIV